MNAVLKTPDVGATTFREIPLTSIRPSPMEAQSHRRAAFSKPALQELAESIRTNGIAQAIVVRPINLDSETPANRIYEIVAGERRFIAAGIAGLERIPATIRELTDEQTLKLQLIENLQREDLHPMHEAESYEELKTKHGYSVDQIWPDVGKSKAYVYGRLKLLALSPKCRKAFYAGVVSASIAEKIARIPVHKLQDEALLDVAGIRNNWSKPMSFRDASDHIHQRYMLDLSGASFPLDDPKLNGAGPCGECPKRAGNQPELFADVKKGDTCTDPTCFAAKTRAYGQQLLEGAKKAGTPGIVGNAAKKIAPNGVGQHQSLREGYHKLDDDIWVGNKQTAAKKLLKPDERPALLEDPKTGNVIEVVHDSQLKRPKREAASNSLDSYEKERRASAARAKLQTSVRRAVFTAIVAAGKWQPPALRMLAELIAEAVDYDGWEAMAKILGLSDEKKKRGHTDSIEDYVKTLKTDEQLGTFVAQCYLAGELHVSSYHLKGGMPRLEAAATFAGVDVAKVRRELAPKKPAKKKAAAKRKK